jgi:hypothetical protein
MRADIVPGAVFPDQQVRFNNNYTSPQTGGFKMTAYLINHLRQPGVVNSEVLDYLDHVQATLDPRGER